MQGSVPPAASKPDARLRLIDAPQKEKVHPELQTRGTLGRRAGCRAIKRQRTWAGNMETAILLATSIVEEQSMYITTYTTTRNESVTPLTEPR